MTLISDYKYNDDFDFILVNYLLLLLELKETVGLLTNLKRSIH